jgi:hypothetical protein
MLSVRTIYNYSFGPTGIILWGTYKDILREKEEMPRTKPAYLI